MTKTHHTIAKGQVYRNKFNDCFFAIIDPEYIPWPIPPTKMVKAEYNDSGNVVYWQLVDFVEHVNRGNFRLSEFRTAMNQ